MSLYAYCLSDEVTARMLADAVGLSGARTHLIRQGDISAVVSEFVGEAVAVTREHVFAHERVVERVLQYTTPLPFRFGTLTSAERLESYMASNRAALLKGMERVRGSVEMSVKIIWDPEEAMREARGVEQPETETAAEENNFMMGSGAAYLAAKRREIMGDELLKERADEIMKWLSHRLNDAAVESESRVNPREQLVIAASHLVRRERLDQYRKATEEARRERPRLRFLTSGPWPPYSFSNINA